MLPPRDQLTLCFAHVAYRFGDRFALRNTGIRFVEVRDRAGLDAAIGEADVLVCSGLWRNDLPQIAPKLKFVQSASAGTDQYDREVLRKAGIRLASGQGVNANAVSEHAIALMLALLRRIPEARDNQAKRFWRGMMGDFSKREDEAGGKTAVVVGLGRIGGRIARLAKALGMHVVGVRQNVAGGAEGADEVHSFRDLKAVLPRADFLILACPLTEETRHLVDAAALALLKPTAQVINVARGRVVDEPAIIAALQEGRIAGAALDVTAEEPLPADSPLWAMPNVLITPHTGGETHRYEDNVLDFMMENIARLQRGETALVNQIV
ncbi:D-2-hydroxyacid dehydrogenase [Roseomonas alkaliterrae]|uniref:Phosphoglycerate dehydrogenase-like enzyme n=1 Tax=Neoroseomonas alkaliterrae TaxID=1452450 RepID=A0A840XTD7_9PROT|nr:D-2-hydroxyacid dehydrogenase [Neoroseomonas alkaliterrae]MBB5690240.1 phosphoglycerate dehydrogenase-like enzyme [Neoroseomonas alkaliterrae]MBR0676521.1 D-2-hydroxyacid dehydrogenase [Neoroseomonas alkaliterrae]